MVAGVRPVDRRPGVNSSPSALRVALVVAALSMLAPFTLDTYLPSFPAIASELSASPEAMQGTLSYYLFAFGLMMLVYGPLSDSLGRRPVVLLALVGYALASLGCALVDSIEGLILMRVGQGLAAGAGLVIGRAVVRDLYEGPQAQRVMSNVMLFFAVAPALAPVLGGLLADFGGWRSVFFFLAVLGLTILLLCVLAMPESLPRAARQSLAPLSIGKAYVRALGHGPFMLLTLTFGLNFGGLFLYIAASPELVYTHLGGGANDFWRLFLPVVSGIVLGSALAGRLAGRLSSRQTVWLGFAVMGGASLVNLWLAVLTEPQLLFVIAPVAVYALGMALAMPALTLMALDCFPARRGMASALMGFAQMVSNGLISSFLVARLSANVDALALGMFVLTALALALWLGWASFSRATVAS